MPFPGEFAALTTAACWAAVSILFTVAARRVGTLALNQTRITLALIVLSTILLLTRGLDWAPGATVEHVLLLVLSGVVGLTFGDWAYFSAFVHVGPRITTLLITLAPPFTAVLAVPLLGETLGPRAWAGMGLILAGVAWVVLERPPVPIPRGHRIRGIFMGVLGSLGQALGLVLSKLGMGEEVDPLAATNIRMAAAAGGVWLIALARGRTGGMIEVARDAVARWATLGATALGPVVGVWFSLVAVKLTEAGVAATLMSTTPILVLPLVIRYEKERVSARAALGAVVAVAGVALLFLR